ncbi:MAG: c-type cytochrome [Wenzhouxiangellaceae bacterium]|nr:c-type cytochrome [Wenzhouxiangellaceae bacterium]
MHQPMKIATVILGETMSTIRKHAGKFALGALLVAGFNIAVAQAPAAVESCTGCHNEDGVSDNPEVPTIAGVGSFFLENQIAIYSEGARPCGAEGFADHEAEDHCAIFSKMSEDDKLAIAEYFGELPYESFDQEADAGLAEQGEAIHEENCARCHTDAGAEPFDDAGILAGQPMPYLIQQFETYKAGERWQPESMAEVMQLSEEEMKALANFYAEAGQ